MTLLINGIEINERAINVESAYHDHPDIAERQHQAALALVIRSLLLQEATTQKIDEPDPPHGDTGEDEDEAHEDGLIRTLLAREVRTPEADEQSCRTYYAANTERFREPDAYEVSHILVVALPDDEPARASARQRAQICLDALLADPSGFAAAALATSACPSASNGGSLGYISRGQTVPEFEADLACMSVGRIHSKLVESRYGFHIVRLDERIHGQQLPFVAVHARIAAYLTESVYRRAVSQYIQHLAARADIQGIDLRIDTLQ
ncbi:hypothetical protein BI364_05015 [Acidihalobacter yilgarnensis]|uniref:peptidylprolyl isomerase n=1 Tax=Acidihalobacter yilgarnensis TaxID=2819280 RepID=A0A1D8ILV5_9GAMM|nr:peptidylprolyl isomerase [Acidihalobacter yilgarnensis]AOU97428.1 hypothetical protein BI364_05015 [Acidihalobacter yilgarnensis]